MRSGGAHRCRRDPRPARPTCSATRASFVEPLVRSDSIHALLARECRALFPDELFGDLFAADVGRRSVPPLVVAVVMVLQRLEGLSDREAVERFTFDARWKYAAAACPSTTRASPTPCSSTCGRASPARSGPTGSSSARSRSRGPRASSASGGCSTPRPLYDAVATMDTVTLVRSAIRGVLGGIGRAGARPAGGPPPRRRLPQRRQARRRLGRRRGARGPRRRARPRRGGRARRARGRAAPAPARRGRHAPRDRARPGPRGRTRRADPDRPAGRPRPGHQHGRSRRPPRPQDRGPRLRRVQGPRRARPRRRARHRDRGHAGQRRRRLGRPGAARRPSSRRRDRPHRRSCTATRRTGRARCSRRSTPRVPSAASRSSPRPASPGPLHQGRLRDRPRRRHRHLPGRSGGAASRATARGSRPASGRLRRLPARRAGARPRRTGARSRSARTRRSSRPGRAATRDPAWRADYRATRPKVERKLAHLVRRRHGGRRARVRGRLKVGADFALLAAAVNLARLAVLGVTGRRDLGGPASAEQEGQARLGKQPATGRAGRCRSIRTADHLIRIRRAPALSRQPVRTRVSHQPPGSCSLLGRRIQSCRPGGPRSR